MALGLFLILSGGVAIAAGVWVGGNLGPQELGNEQQATATGMIGIGFFVVVMGALTALMPWPRMYPAIDRFWRVALDAISDRRNREYEVGDPNVWMDYLMAYFNVGTIIIWAPVYFIATIVRGRQS